MPVYDRAFNPPAPVADVTVANPVATNKRFLLRGKLDTGADITVIPEKLFHRSESVQGAVLGHADMTVLTRNVRFIMFGSPWKVRFSQLYAPLPPIAPTSY